MKKKLRKNNKRHARIDRLHVISGVFFLLAAIIVVRLFSLQVLQTRATQEEAMDQRAIDQELLPRRGEVFAQANPRDNKELQPVAINEKRSLVYAVPSEIEDPETVAFELAEALEIGEEEILPRILKKGDPYEPLKHAVKPERAKVILEKGFRGIYTRTETVRAYPMSNALSHVSGFFGFVDDERRGQYGIEGYFENQLSGVSGRLETELDPLGRLIALADRSFTPAEDGVDVILTIDANVQQRACTLIKEGVEKYTAQGGNIIVMDPKTGAIRALCNVPDFNPNEYSEVDDTSVYLNSAISSTYEPGSIFKPITMAAALDSGSVKADTEFEDLGEVTFGEDVIRNADNEVYGVQTMSEVLENSVNTGTVFAAMQTGRSKFKKYVEAFGFGKPIGITLPSEAEGNISSLNKRSDIYLATASFGQGITVTPIQMVQAFGVIANQGRMVKPHIVHEIQRPNGEVEPTEIIVSDNIISTQTAAILSAMMVNVIEKGHARAGMVPGFYLAGKTGTAQIAGERGGYSEQTNHSFVGFGPVNDPKFVIFVKLERPSWGRFSANTVAPIFSDLANFLLQYYQVPPER